MIRNSAGVVVMNSQIHHTTTGINHLNSQNISLEGNDIHDLQVDGIRGGGSSNVTISGNKLTDFYPKEGDHPDAIQFWTTNTSATAHDLVIKDNTFVRGRGQRIQGIFLGNEEKIPFEDVTISGNYIIGGMYHGISVYYGSKIKVYNNIVQGYVDMNSWIMMDHTSDASISNNRATSFQFQFENKDLKESGNREVPAAQIGDLSILKGLTRAPLTHGQ